MIIFFLFRCNDFFWIGMFPGIMEPLFKRAEPVYLL